MKTKKLNAYERIQQAMKDNEKSLLAHIQACNKNEHGYVPFLPGRAWSGALDRLKDKGKVKYRKSRIYSKCGYWVINS